VILDTNGNIFGGFTPVEWESPLSPQSKTDDSLKSFVFTLTNPNNVDPRKFVLKTAKKHRAIGCDSRMGPHFDDIRVFDQCNRNVDNYTSAFGYTYTNDTGIGGKPGFNTLLTASGYFKVSEIEVFEIAI
jgi:hypothetical protein